MKPLVRRALVLLVAAGIGWYLAPRPGPAPPPAGGLAAPVAQSPAISGAPADTDEARAAFEARASGRMVRVDGVVRRTLADDNDGSRHQRFLIDTSSGLSLLISHNIDLAPRLEGLAAGEAVQAFGEYEWNEKGGLMHWTHHDPAKNHQEGYIEWRGRKYR
jgi:hypothetical protein